MDRVVAAGVSVSHLEKVFRIDSILAPFIFIQLISGIAFIKAMQRTLFYTERVRNTNSIVRIELSDNIRNQHFTTPDYVLTV